MIRYAKSSGPLLAHKRAYFKENEAFRSAVGDLFRAVTVQVGKSNGAGALGERWANLFPPALDALQLELDRRRFASEVHLVLETVR